MNETANDIISYLKEDICFVESYALVLYAFCLIQIKLHVNLYTVAHLCSMNICGMISFGGLLSE